MYGFNFSLVPNPGPPIALASDPDEPYTVSNDGPFGLLSGVDGTLMVGESGLGATADFNFDVGFFFASGGLEFDVAGGPGSFPLDVASLLSIAAGNQQSVKTVGLAFSSCAGRVCGSIPPLSLYTLEVTQI